MIKKVSSWVLGSFFRQFGRFLFFVVLGGLIFLLIQHNDIDFKFTDLLGFETVKALSLDGSVYTNYDFWDYSQQFNLNNDRYGSNQLTWSSNFDHNNLYAPYDNMYIVFPIKGFAQRIEQSNQSGTWLTDVELSNVLVWIRLYYSNNSFTPCELQNNFIVCPVKKNQTYTGMQISAHIPDSQAQTFLSVNEIQFIVDKTGWFYTSATTNIIINQNDNTQDIINSQNNQTQAIQDYFSDTNTTDDSNSTTSFFSNTTSSSETALTSIVSSPITMINSLVVGSHNDICFTLNSKNVCFPSGDIIWNRQHGGAGVHDHWFRGGSTQGFIDFFNLVVGGYVLYKCLVSLFHLVHKLLDPTQTYVEVMKL